MSWKELPCYTVQTKNMPLGKGGGSRNMHELKLGMNFWKRKDTDLLLGPITGKEVHTYFTHHKHVNQLQNFLTTSWCWLSFLLARRDAGDFLPSFAIRSADDYS